MQQKSFSAPEGRHSMGEETGPIGPFAGWARRDWIAFWVCLAVGMAVMEGVKEAAGDSLGFWLLIAVRIAAGGAAVLVAWAVWARVIRPKP